MSMSKGGRKQVQRGVVDTLASGALRVRVDGGIDPVTKKRHRLTEIIPAGTPNQRAEAENARVRLVNEVNERRNPKTRATVNQLLERYLNNFDGAYSTENNYRNLWKNHVERFIGKVKVGELDADILDSLYAELRRCRDHCTGPFYQHRTGGEHTCDSRCARHQCKPLGVSAIRQVHWLLSGAFASAVRWKWVAANPVSTAAVPAPPAPKPQPPSATDAAAIVDAAARSDLDWATLIWLAMTTGARRHELCALHWTDFIVDSDGAAVLWIRRGISKNEHGQWAELDTKTHQQRRVALDPGTVAVLTEHRARCAATVERLGATLAADAFLFSGAPDYTTFLLPGSVTQRYDRMVNRLHIETTLHKLRHYSATELIKAGLDINTVSGRLGHGGGGTTTLKYYAGWVSEADQRAAASLGARMPARPWASAEPSELAKTEPQAPYEVIAAGIRQQVLEGAYEDGAPGPTIKELAELYGVSVGTAHRAVELLRAWGLLTGGGRGRRPTMVRSEPAATEVVPSAEPVLHADGSQPLELEVLRLGAVMRRFRTEADPSDSQALAKLLRDAVLRGGGTSSTIGEYELNVRTEGGELLTTYVLFE